MCGVCVCVCVRVPMCGVVSGVRHARAYVGADDVSAYVGAYVCDRLIFVSGRVVVLVLAHPWCVCMYVCMYVRVCVCVCVCVCV